MYFDINLKLLSGTNTQKVNKQNMYSGFVKLGVGWAEQDRCHYTIQGFFFLLDSKNDDLSKKILEQLETIDDDCDRHGIILVKLDNAEEAAQYG